MLGCQHCCSASCCPGRRQLLTPGLRPQQVNFAIQNGCKLSRARKWRTSSTTTWPTWRLCSRRLMPGTGLPGGHLLAGCCVLHQACRAWQAGRCAGCACAAQRVCPICASAASRGVWVTASRCASRPDTAGACNLTVWWAPAAMKQEIDPLLDRMQACRAGSPAPPLCRIAEPHQMWWGISGHAQKHGSLAPLRCVDRRLSWLRPEPQHLAQETAQPALHRGGGPVRGDGRPGAPGPHRTAQAALQVSPRRGRVPRGRRPGRHGQGRCRALWAAALRRGHCLRLPGCAGGCFQSS